MWEIILKMLLCLLIAAIIGGIIGWLLRSLFCKKRCDELEADLSSRDSELAELRLALSKTKNSANTENNKDDDEITKLKARISSLEGELSASGNLAAQTSGADGEWKTKYLALETELKSTKADLSVCHERQTSIESELRGWESKAARVATPSVATLVSSSNDDETAKLKAQIANLQVQIKETETEKTFLLGRIKKAESGESITQIVPMEQRDDLELVHGIGPVLERMLYDMKIYFFKDIASWDAAKIAEITEQLPGFQGRIEREGWIESAKEEHFKKYGERL